MTNSLWVARWAPADVAIITSLSLPLLNLLFSSTSLSLRYPPALAVDLQRKTTVLPR